MKDILSAITKYREQRGWTEYQLAEQSGLPQSTISSWYRKNMIPNVQPETTLMPCRCYCIFAVVIIPFIETS